MKVYNGKYGWSTLCKNKDLGGNEIKCYMPVKFKRGQEPLGQVDEGVDVKVLDYFMSCYQNKQGQVLPTMIITEWKFNEPRTESQKIASEQEPTTLKDFRAVQQPLGNEMPRIDIQPDDLPFY